MANGTNTYLKAIEITRKILEPPVGLSKYDATSRQDKEQIRQNNAIIQMLIYIYDKLDQIESRIKICDKYQIKKESPKDKKIDALISQIGN